MTDANKPEVKLKLSDAPEPKGDSTAPVQEAPVRAKNSFEDKFDFSNAARCVDMVADSVRLKSAQPIVSTGKALEVVPLPGYAGSATPEPAAGPELALAKGAPVKEAKEQAKAAPDYSRYTINREVAPTNVSVKNGDTVSQIAERHLGKGATANQIWRHTQIILQMNNLDPEKPKIKAGDVLKLPGHTAEGGVVLLNDAGKRVVTMPKPSDKAATKPADPLKDADGRTLKKWGNGTIEAVAADGSGYLQTPNGFIHKWGTAHDDHTYSFPKIEKSADTIKGAINFQATDTKTIIAELTGKNETALRELDAAYRAKYHKSLEDELKPVLSGAEFDKVIGLLHARDSADLDRERTNLKKLLASNLQAGLVPWAVQDMQRLEGRKGKDNLNNEEIARTYRNVSRLLEAQGNHPLGQEARRKLAKQILENVANPTLISQGKYNTCNVTTIEARIYTRTPSEAARLVTDVALSGRYLANGGPAVIVDATPHGQSRSPVKLDGQRSHASEIFEVTAVNLKYAEEKERTGKDIRYRQEEIPAVATSKDSGERLMDHSTNPPVEVMLNGTPRRMPSLPTNDLVAIANKISNRKDTLVALAHQSYDPAGPGSAVTSIDSEQKLNDTLAEAKRNQSFPLILLVNTKVDPFWTDSGAGAGGDLPGDGSHVVTITGYQAGPPPKVAIDNQWTKDKDYVGKPLDAKDLYRAMLSTREATRQIGVEVVADRQNGKVDFRKEVDYLRLQRENKEVTEVQLADGIRSVVDKANELWAKPEDKTDAATKKSLRTKLAEAANRLPLEQNLAALKHMETTKFLDPSDFDYRVSLAGWRLGREVRDLKAEGKYSAPTQVEYDRKLKALEDYIKAIPKERGDKIQKDTQTWLERN